LPQTHAYFAFIIDANSAEVLAGTGLFRGSDEKNRVKNLDLVVYSSATED
jgi:hypothetical protein